MSDPSLDRRLLDMYIISCYYCRRSRVGVTGTQYQVLRLVMMLLGSRCRCRAKHDLVARSATCTLFSVSDFYIRKIKFGEYLEFSRSLFGDSRYSCSVLPVQPYLCIASDSDGVRAY